MESASEEINGRVNRKTNLPRVSSIFSLLVLKPHTLLDKLTLYEIRFIDKHLLQEIGEYRKRFKGQPNDIEE